jgi:DNA-binding winged helix-turn-helix (wHTH) protein/TolB-like protein
MGHQPKQIYEFGPYRLDPDERLLLRDGAGVPLQPKVFDLLLTLVERHGRLLEKDELMRLVWPDTVVEEANLANNISILRRTLSENGQQFIETVPKRGYRFVAPVQELVAQTGVGAGASTPGKAAATERQDAPSSKPSARGLIRWMSRRPRLAALLFILLLAGLAGVFGYQWQARQAKPAASNSAIRSIAVLPFKPLSPESQDEALQMGMAETLILKLSNLKQLSVRSINSVRKYANPDQDPLAAGREQKADFVLDSSFQRNGEKIRVTSRLVNPADGTAIWTYQCDEEYCENLFLMQDVIAGKVAAALSLHLTGAEQERMRKHYTENKTAYQLYLLGRYFWSKRTGEAVKKSIVCFNQAIEKDPDYALAFAGLADSYIILGVYSELPPKDVFPKAKAAAMNALKIDDDLAEAHASLAEINADYYWDWVTAEREFKRAIELNPNYATAHQWYSEFLSIMGRFDEAITEMQRAQELEPLSLVTSTAMGLVLYRARQNNQAIEQWRKTLEIDPNFWMTHFYLGLAYVQEGKYGAAVSEFHKGKTLSEDDSNVIALLGYAQGLAGKRSEAQKILDKLTLLPKQKYISPFSIAEIYIGLGEKDRAFEWLEKAYEDRTWLLRILNVEPIFDPIRSDPRFTDLLRRIGLAP